MTKISNLCVLLIFIFITPSFSARWSNWKTHAKQYEDNMKWEIEYVSKGNVSCLKLGKGLLSQQVAKVYDDFDECQQDMLCSSKKERIFHKRAEDIEVLTGLCASTNCTYLDRIDRHGGSSLLELAMQCSYLNIVRNAVRRSVIWFDGDRNSSCWLETSSGIRSAAFKFIEKVYECRTSISPHNVENALRRMDVCSKSHRNDLEKYVAGKRSEFVWCSEVKPRS